MKTAKLILGWIIVSQLMPLILVGISALKSEGLLAAYLAGLITNLIMAFLYGVVRLVIWYFDLN